MRNPNRIPIVLKFFRENPVQLNMFLYNNKLVKSPELTEEFEVFWLENPDLRLGQALINKGIIGDGQTWFKEEVDCLIGYGYFKFEELNFWGSNFDKDHIQNIIKFFDNKYIKLHPDYLKYFNKRLKSE